MLLIKSVAVIGCGPAGAITIDALVQERVFEKITVFERREKPGGCWSVIFANALTEVETLPGFRTRKDTFSTCPTSRSWQIGLQMSHSSFLKIFQHGRRGAQSIAFRTRPYTLC